MTLKSRLFLFFYFLFPALTAFAAIVWLASIPSDSQNAILFGMSKSRLLIAGILGIAAGASIFLSIQVSKTIYWLEEKLDAYRHLILFALISLLLFVASFIFLAIPDKYLGEFWAIEERLRPLIIWLLLVSIQAVAGLVGWQIRKNDDAVAALKTIAIPCGITLALLLLIWAFIAVTHLGLSGENSFWSKAGVPILWPQVMLSLGMALFLQFLLTRFTKIPRRKIWLDIGLCVLIWLAAVILWSNQSYVPGVFNTQPRPPTNEIYPINDSSIFDLAAQKMLIGQKMSSDVLDKPLFIACLALLHWLAGDSFNTFYLLQIISYALIPIVGYFLGKTIHSRAFGVMFGILLIIKEQNAIALTNYIHVSTSKMILSEPLTTLGVLLFTWLLVRWLKKPILSNSNLWLAGGILGLTFLVRLNSIGILPAVILLIGFAYKFQWKPWATASVIVSMFLIISAIPWLVRNAAINGSPFSFINSKTSGVIVNQRYNPLIERNAPPKNETNTPVPETSRFKKYLTIGQSAATNYIHNLIGITVMLPPSLELYRLLDEIRLPYWKVDWDGSLLPGAFWIILAVLALTALGIASTWKRWRVAGLAPLAVILGYNIPTAVSLTSGGRYLVPMDWCVLLYFSMGLFDSTRWLLTLFGWPGTNEILQPQPVEQSKKPIFSMPIAALMFLVLGGLPIYMETLPVQRYPVQVNINDFAEANQSVPELSDFNIKDSIISLSKDSSAKVYYGRALYPRYYGENKGDSDVFDILPLISNTNYDHLSFYLISTTDEASVILPTSDKISPALAVADMWVLGCQREHYFEAMLVIFRASDITKVYRQEPFKTSCQ